MGLRDLFRRRRDTAVQQSTYRDRFTRRARFESLEQRTLLAVWPGVDPSLWNDIDPNLLPKDDDPLFSIGEDLAAYYREYEAWDGTGEFAPSDSRVRTDNGLVSLRLMVGGDGADFVEAVEALGMKVVETDAGKLTGWIPTDKLDDLAAVEGINTAWPTRLDPIGDDAVGDGGSILGPPSSDVIPPMDDSRMTQVRVGFRTDAQIEDIDAYVESLDWPAEIDLIQPDSVKQLLSFPWMQEDGTFRTIARFEVVTSVGPHIPQELINTLEGLEFISYAKLEREHPRVFTDQMQRSIDAITTTASQEQAFLFGNDSSPATSRGIRVGFRTDGMIDDIEAYVESLDWPAEIGMIMPDSVEQLLSIPRMQDGGTFRTIARFDVITSLGPDVQQNLIDTLEGLEFIDYAKFESESPRHFPPGLQEAVDRITTRASKRPIYGGPAYTIDDPGSSLDLSSRLAPPPDALPLRIGVRVGFRTQTKIDDIDVYVESLDWPAEIGGIVPRSVEQLLSKRMQDGTIRTITRFDFDVIISLGPDALQNVIDSLEGLGFIDYAKLESKHPRVFTPRSQELADAITTGGSKELVYGGPAYTIDDPGSGLDLPPSEVIRPSDDYFQIGAGEYLQIGVRVGFRTDAKIEDIDAYVESLDWPVEIGGIQSDSVKQLLAMPWMQEDGTFRTIARFDLITGLGPDVQQNVIDTLEGLEFISYAKLESEHPQVFSDQLQKSVNAITTGAAPGWFYASGNEFSPVQDSPSDPIDEIGIQVTLPEGSLEPTIIEDSGEQTGEADFYAAGVEVALWNAGSYNVAKSFDQVHAFSGWLDGTADDDLFYGNSTVARMWANGW